MSREGPPVGPVATATAALAVLALVVPLGACASEANDDEAATDDVTTATEGETTTTAPTTTAAPTPAPTTLSGGGDTSTDPFTLDGGRYAVHYRFDGSCYYSATLESPSGEPMLVDLGTGDGPVEGDTNAYAVEPGDYYVQVITGPAPNCPWEITLTPAD